MLGRRGTKGELDPPPLAKEDSSFEVLRVWELPDGPQQLTLQTTWENPGAWGLLLVDIARHAAKAYEREGHDPDEVLTHIRSHFDEEWSEPTDSPLDLTDET